MRAHLSSAARIGKRILDRIALTVPVFREITINANAARFSRTLSVLLRAGLPVTEIMDLVVRTTDNGILRAGTSKASASV